VTTFNSVVHLIYLASASSFVLGLHLMNSPATARRGNQLSAAGMTVAIGTTVVVLLHENMITTTGWIVLVAGGLIGAGAGLYAARSVAMTAMPQLVSVFNAVGGGAAALLAVSDLAGGHADRLVGVTGSLDILIGAVTFTGSVVAAGKLQGVITGSPVVFPGARLLNVVLGLGLAAGVVWLIIDPSSTVALVLLGIASLAFGVTMVLPIGGADMPVVISLLNAFTGTAVAMAGFVLGNVVMIIAGALVGASGGILTKLMADAMNRSIPAIIVGGFGTGDSVGGEVAGGGGSIRSVSADDVAIQLAYASKVIIVPGYGLAAAQAQHELAGLADLLEHRGVEVSYAIHPVAGRMPGHMNVLLAEANVPYDEVFELDDINRDFASTDVAFVIGANDVTNPAAKTDPHSPIYGMPILDVEKAHTVLFVKRGMASGYAGVDNTMMLFADAKVMTENIVKALEGSAH
jgi:H+-translocating NAD(P) transhydrogenase subunit beta